MTSLFSQIDLKEALNEAQYKAVTSNTQALLVLAGAGSGKTRVITYRIARLLNEGVRPYQILAVTFTNKAAGEMRERIVQLAGPDAKRLWMSTFHSVSVRLLRREFEHLGRPTDFAIYDTDDSESVIRETLRALDISAKDFTPRNIRGTISYFKNHLLGPENAREAIASVTDPYSPYAEVVLKVYPEYEKRLLAANALDFDDLLLYPLRLFEKCPDVLKRYQDRFKHVLVDEYQDTNRAQYRFTQLLGQRAETICVVGDDDQSIYRWRGALLENLEKFREDFAPVEVIPLEENYRSSAPILEGATSVVNANPRRHPKKLHAMREGDELIHLLTVADEEAEAEKVVSRIDHWTRTTREFGLSDCAVFFRTAAQSRPIEEVLMRRGIPYTLVGGIRFYERKEVKDILAYARAAFNPRDEQALRRIAGLGHWKVGARTLDQALHLASRLGKTLYELTTEDLTGTLRTTGASRFGKLQSTLRNWRQALGSDELSLSVWFHRIIQQSNYLEYLTEQKSDREAQRQLEGIKQNLDQMVSAAGEFSDQLLEALETSQEPPTLQNQLELFLAQCSLMSDVDYWTDINQSQDSDFDPGKVTLMTLHSAKGLEFPVVFIVGCEEELIPHTRSADSVAGLEEERRLMYVGMTRAEKRLVLSCAHCRRIYGRSMSRIRSRFLKDIPSSCIRYIQDEAPASPGREDQLQTGDKVIHKIFGQGRVLGVMGRGMGQKVEVDFFKHGRKTLMQAYAKMRKL